MAQKLKFGNGTWATKKGSTLAYSDTNNAFKPLPFTTTRNSIATRVNKEGLIEVVGNDVPRIDYTDSTEGALLLEPSRTNVFLNSNKFDTTWQGNYTVLTSGQVGVGGSKDAWMLSGFAGTSQEKRIRQYPPSSGIYTVSVYAKAGTVDYLWLRGVTSSANKRTFFNLSTGQIGLDSAVSSSMIDMGDGWYRCEAVFNQQSGFEFYIGLSDTENAATSTTGNIYIQYAQAEQGSYPTSYIPTSGSTATRLADTASGSGNSEVFNDSEGVLFADIAALANDLTYRSISIGDGSGVINLFYSNVSNTIVASSAGGALIIKQLSDITNFNKVIFKYKQNDFSLWVNGFEIGTDTSGTTGDALTTLSFDNNSGGSRWYGKTKEIGYYDEILTDLELETLTSYRSLNELVTELNLNTL